MRQFFLGLFVGLACAIGWMSLASPELQLELGQARYHSGLPDTFYNSDLHTDSYLRPLAGSIGVADKWQGSERFGWRLAFLASGSIAARDNTAANDSHAHNHVACVPPDEAGCMVRFNGAGETFGVVASLTAEEPLTARLSLIGEAGLYFFQHHFKAEARFTDCASCARQISYNETSRLWDEPSPMLGLTLRYAKPFGMEGIALYFSARHYGPAGHRALSYTDFAHVDYMLGLARQFR